VPNDRRDPRTVDKLLDGVNITCDDLHAWLTVWQPPVAPAVPASTTSPPLPLPLGGVPLVSPPRGGGGGFGGVLEGEPTLSSPSQSPRHLPAPVRVTLTFDAPTTLSMARLFNYNKSRIHSYRGVRWVRLCLDGRRIFEGEVKKAPGHVPSFPSPSAALTDVCEHILFTADPEILERIEENDPYASFLREEGGDGASSAAPGASSSSSYRLAAALIQDAARPPTAETAPDGSVTAAVSARRRGVDAATAAAASAATSLLRRRTRAGRSADFVPYREAVGSALPATRPATSALVASVPGPVASPKVPLPPPPPATLSPRGAAAPPLAARAVPAPITEEDIAGLMDGDSFDQDDGGEAAGSGSFDEDGRGTGGAGAASGAAGDGAAASPSSPCPRASAVADTPRRAADDDLDALLRHVEVDLEADRVHHRHSGEGAPSPQQRPTASPPPPPPPPAASLLRPGRLGLSVPLASLPRGRLVTLRLLSTHGDPHYGGLTGLQVRIAVPSSSSSSSSSAAASAAVGIVRTAALSARNLFARPRDINGDDGSGDDPRTLDKLLDPVNVTTDDTHMWLFPFTPTDPEIVWGADAGGQGAGEGHDRDAHILQVDLGREEHIVGLTVYNYNKSPEDTLRGVRHVAVDVDGRAVRSGPLFFSGARGVSGGGGGAAASYDVIPLRKAPGSAAYDFAQHLDFALAYPSATNTTHHGRAPLPLTDGPSIVLIHAASAAAAGPALLPLPRGPAPPKPLVPRQDCEPQQLPSGLEVKLVFPASCGDLHYLGVDAVALYDAEGRRIPVLPWQVTASPASVNDATHEGGGGGGSSSSAHHLPDVRVPSNLAFVAPPESEYAVRFGGAQGMVQNECVARRDDPALYLPSSSSGAASTRNPPFPASRSWLAPLSTPHPDIPGRVGNVLTFSFDTPVALSLLRLFNYSKTPARGAGAVECWVDGLCVFSGELQPAGGGAATGGAAGGGGAVRPRTSCAIAFTHDPRILAQDASLKHFPYCGQGEQEVVHWDSGRIVGKLSRKAELAADAAIAAARAVGRPRTSLPR
jgi:hypothetical protein